MGKQGAYRKTTPKNKCPTVTLTRSLPNRRKRLCVDLLPGLQKGGGDFRGANEMETMLPPRPGQGGGLSGPQLLNYPRCPGRSRRNWDVTSGELVGKTPSDLAQCCLASSPTSSPKEGVGQPPRMGF